MTILDLIQKTTPFLEKAGVPNARLDVEWLLAHVLKMRRMDLYLQFGRVLTESELNALRPLVKRRAEREPLQHLLGVVEFCGLELTVSRDALIPRPETELLVEEVLAQIPLEASVKVLDIGTGTGAIALAVAHARPRVQMTATDLSSKALLLALSNAQKLGLAERVEFRQGDLFEALRDGEVYDLILSNPPYIVSNEIDFLQPEVAQHDPRVALDGGEDGLKIIRRIALEGRKFLNPTGKLFLEMGANQEAETRKILEETNWKEVEIRKDLRRIPRIAQAIRERSAL